MEVRTAIEGPCCNPSYWETRQKEWDNARELYNVKCGTCKEVYPVLNEERRRTQQFDSEHPFT